MPYSRTMSGQQRRERWAVPPLAVGVATGAREKAREVGRIKMPSRSRTRRSSLTL